TGKCRWVTPYENGKGYLAIPANDGAMIDYAVTELHPDPCCAMRAWELENIIDGKIYHVHEPATGQPFMCDCPDCTYRQRECKHAKALRAALKAIGQSAISQSAAA